MTKPTQFDFVFEPKTVIDSTHNQPEFSVTELSSMLKRTVEENFSYVRVRGEISGLKVAPSGHVYFSLKDENSVLSAVCWKGTASKLPIKPEEGLEVICTGAITTFAGQSKYQMIVEDIKVAGAGVLMALLQKLKEKLHKEGLFDPTRKKKIPLLPTTIGIVTSPTGAVIRDILHRLEERMPVNVLLWPVLVQGEMAASQIAAAINGFNLFDTQSDLKVPDVIIVARGGGSIEDLWAFNEEIVVRATANSKIPIISAIGHETDTTLIDYASDLRAPTPTAAAELAVPVRSQLLLRIDTADRRMQTDIYNLLEVKRNYLSALGRGLPNYNSILANANQRFDDLTHQLAQSLPRFMEAKRNFLAKSVAGLRHPQESINSKKALLEFTATALTKARISLFEQKLHKITIASSGLRLNPILQSMTRHTSKIEECSLRLQNQLNQSINNRQKQLSLYQSLLISYNYTNILARGFTIIRDENNQLMTSATMANAGSKVQIEFKDGLKNAEIK